MRWFKIWLAKWQSRFDYVLRPPVSEGAMSLFIEREASVIRDKIKRCEEVSRLYCVFDAIQEFRATCGYCVQGKSWYDSLMLDWNNRLKQVK